MYFQVFRYRYRYSVGTGRYLTRQVPNCTYGRYLPTFSGQKNISLQIRIRKKTFFIHNTVFFSPTNYIKKIVREYENYGIISLEPTTTSDDYKIYGFYRTVDMVRQVPTGTKLTNLEVQLYKGQKQIMYLPMKQNLDGRTNTLSLQNFNCCRQEGYLPI